jgi:ribosomal protein L9
VLLAEPIKQLGMYSIKVQLHKEVETKIKLWIISDESK